MGLRFLTAGESHGRQITAILEGIPSGLAVDRVLIDRDLKRRQKGYGRGARMAIERDRVVITAGVRWGETIGSPIALVIENLDWPNWSKTMSPDPADAGSAGDVTLPRPGHADLAGALKYGHKDIRNVLERSSARETAARVAAGAVARCLLGEFDITIGSRVVEIGGSDVRKGRGVDHGLVARIIDEARDRGDTVGGVFEVWSDGVPVGLGSYVQWDRRFDGRLAGSVMSIPGIKGVEIGLGFEAGRRPGSRVHDEIAPGRGGSSRGPFMRRTNNAGGIEGGVTNGERMWLRAVMKPIPTLRSPLKTVDIRTGRRGRAAVHRSDVCAVFSAAVVGEAMVALEVASAMLEKFGMDSLVETKRNWKAYLQAMKGRG